MLYEITYQNGSTDEVEADSFILNDGFAIFLKSDGNPEDPEVGMRPVCAIRTAPFLDESKEVVGIEVITYEDDDETATDEA